MSAIEIGEWGHLACPRGGEMLHQDSYKIHNRFKEDGAGQVITVQARGDAFMDEGATQPDDPDLMQIRPTPAVGLQVASKSRLPHGGWISPRRQGLGITFFCEECEGNHVLRIYQHKGWTILEWAE